MQTIEFRGEIKDGVATAAARFILQTRNQGCASPRLNERQLVSEAPAGATSFFTGHPDSRSLLPDSHCKPLHERRRASDSINFSEPHVLRAGLPLIFE